MAQKTRIRKLYVMEEATFSTDPDNTGAGYLYIRADSDLAQIGAEVVESTMQNNRLVQTPPAASRVKATLSFKVPLRANGVPSAPPSTPAAAPELDLLLKNCIGSVIRGQSSTVTAGGTTTSVKVTASTGFQVGGIVYLTAPGLARYITAIPDGTTLTIAPALAGACTTGNAIAGNYYIPATANLKSLAFVAVCDTALYTLLGCRPTAMKIDGFDAGGRPMLNCTYEADNFSSSAKASLPAANDRFPAVVSPMGKGSPIWAGGVDANALAFEFDFGMASAWLESTSAANGRYGWDITNRAPKGSLESMYSSQYLTDLMASTQEALGLMCGSQLNGWGLYAPWAQYTSHALQDKNGLLSSKVEFGIYDPGASAPEFVLTVF